MINPRNYQSDSVVSVMDYWRAGGGNPLVDMATGLGKSVVIAMLVKNLLEQFPAMRVLVLVDSKELVLQNFQAFMKLWPQAPAGIYAAGLKRRDAHNQITFASIQSVYRKAKELGPRHLVLVDEAHMLPADGEGMYLTLLEALREQVPDLRVAGLTATPYRMKTGRLDEGGGRIFDQIVYSYGIGQGVDDGWLVPLTAKPGDGKISTVGVHRRGGEFVAGELEDRANDITLIRAAVADMCLKAADRRSWLVFCTGVKHTMNVCAALQEAGINAAFVTGDSTDRDHVIREFKAGRIRALCNAEVLTKGFDAPNVDMIAELRPTASAGLYTQILGRGTRPVWPSGFDPNTATVEERHQAIAHSVKPNCLVLDFTSNGETFGPVDAIEVASKRKGASVSAREGQVMGKDCPECESLAALNARVCKDCGYEWPPGEIQHAAEATETAVMSRDLKVAAAEPLRVHNWTPRKHAKPGAPPSVRVEYMAGMQVYREWLLFEHGGYPARKAGQWWRLHGGQLPVPATSADAIVRWPELNAPATITTRPSGKWFEIVGRTFESQQQQEGEAA